MWIGHRKEIRTQTLPALALNRRGRANAHVSFRISLLTQFIKPNYLVSIWLLRSHQKTLSNPYVATSFHLMATIATEW